MAISLEDDGRDWMTKLKEYADPNNKSRALADFTRAQSKYNYQNSIGDTAGAAASKQWMNQVDTATGGLLSKPTNKVDSAMDKFESYLNNTMARKAFDPNTDTQYQTALAAAKQNVLQGAQTATNNAMVSLGSRGIGNSSVAVDRANQIGQQANAKIQTEITPQLMEQAYNRYLAEQNLAQQDLRNLGSFVDMTNSQYQQGLDNKYRDETLADSRKAANWNAYRDSVGLTQNLGTGPKSDWSLLGSMDGAPTFTSQRANVGDQQWNKTYDRGVLESDREFQSNEAYKKAQIEDMQAGRAISQANASRSAQAQDISTKMEIWRNTGIAPEGIPGVAAGTRLADAKSSQIANLKEEKQGLVEALRSGSITPAAAYKQIQEDRGFGFYTEQEAAELQAVVQSFSQKTPQPANTTETLTKDQQDAMPSANQLDKLYKEQGKPIGAPELDWKSWYKDPLGRVSGVDFATWQKLYGPQLKAK